MERSHAVAISNVESVESSSSVEGPGTARAWVRFVTAAQPCRATVSKRHEVSKGSSSIPASRCRYVVTLFRREIVRRRKEKQKKGVEKIASASTVDDGSKVARCLLITSETGIWKVSVCAAQTRKHSLGRKSKLLLDLPEIAR